LGPQQSILSVESANSGENEMGRIAKSISLFVALFVGLMGSGFAQDSAKQDMKDAGHETKQAAKDTGHATKTTAKKTGHTVEKDTKKVTHKAAQKTEQGARKVEDKTAPQ
jgi:hypothetical protein